MKKIFYRYSQRSVNISTIAPTLTWLTWQFAILIFVPLSASAQGIQLANHIPGHFGDTGTPDQRRSGGSQVVYNHPADDFSGEGRPTNRRSGGLRTGDPNQDPCLNQVIALVPGLGDVNNLAENCAVTPESSEAFLAHTAVATPTLWFYVATPVTPELMANLVLLDDENQVVAKQSVPIAATPGVISIQLNDSLEPNRPYRWIFSVLTHELATRNSEVEGWVQWVPTEVDSELSLRLAAASPREQAIIYAADGYWHDALTALAELRQSEPDNVELDADWSSLLNQVGLDAIAPIPLVACCQGGEPMSNADNLGSTDPDPRMGNSR